MASPNDISTCLSNIDSRKDSIRRAILTLALEWKDLDKHLDSTNDAYVADLESKQNDVANSYRELNEVRESLDKQLQEIEDREEKLRSFHQDKVEQLDLKEKQLSQLQALIEERTRECETREEKLLQQTKSLEVLSRNIDKEKADFVDIQESVCEKLKEIHLKEKNCERISREVNLIQDWTEGRSREVYSIEEEFKLKEEKLGFEKKSMEEQLKNFEKEKEQFEGLRKSVTDKLDEIGLKERNLEDRSKELDLGEVKLSMEKGKIEKEKEDIAIITEEINEIFLKEKNYKELSKEVKLRVDRVAVGARELDSKEEQIRLTEEQLKSKPKLEGKKTMDGVSLQLYVCKHRNNDSAVKEICEIIKASSDPAKLVLEAMEGFYYPCQVRKGEVEFNSVVRKSCILLLEKLMLLSPQIGPDVKEAALSLACEWNMKMDVSKHELEVLAFLQLLASYKLASDFDADQLLQHLEFLAFRSEAVELCRALDLSEKVPDLVVNLTRNNKHCLAVKFIVEFDLVEKFTPLPLLQDHLRASKTWTKNRRRMDNNAVDAQETAAKMEFINAFKAALDCVKLRWLESNFSIQNLEALIEEMEKQVFDLNTSKKRKQHSEGYDQANISSSKNQRRAAFCQQMNPDVYFHPSWSLPPPYHHAQPFEFPREPTEDYFGKVILLTHLLAIIITDLLLIIGPWWAPHRNIIMDFERNGDRELA